MATDQTPQLQSLGQFVPRHSSKLPGDKIILPPSSLEALLSASSSAAASAPSSQPQANGSFNPYSRVAQRQSEAQFSDQKNALPHPLTFRIVNPSHGEVVYAGVQEFSAEDDDELVLSTFIWQALGLPKPVPDEGEGRTYDALIQVDKPIGNRIEMPLITVHACQLPKGTYVKLRPLEAGYDPEDWKALLERHLRLNYTTLTDGAILAVPGQGRNKDEEFRFRIDGFKPESDGVCVVDTDLEVDIEALDEEQARETLEKIAAKLHRPAFTATGSSTGCDLKLFRTIEGDIVPGEYIDYTLHSWPRDQPLQIRLTTMDEDNDANILVSPFSTRQRVRPRLEQHVFGHLGSPQVKTIILEPTNAELQDADALYITVYAFSSQNGTHNSRLRRFFTLNVKPVDLSEDTTHAASLVPTETTPNEGDVRCTNCLQWVPSRTFMLHDTFCLRNNALCGAGCGQLFKMQSADWTYHWHCDKDAVYGNSDLTSLKHEMLFHPDEPFECECDTTREFETMADLAQHKVTVCPNKLILCRFCHLENPQEGDPDVPNPEAVLSGLTVHELVDGGRTTECHLCSRIVKLKDMSTHLRHHDMERKSRPAPRTCRNVNCGRTLDGCNHSGDTRAGLRMGQGAGNDIGLCSTCYAPLYVSLYDPENKALKRRVERRYMQQLLTGCGKPWCTNEFCKTGRANQHVEPASLSTKDALPLIRDSVDGVLSGHGDMRFCVDEQSQKRRNVAALLAAERGLRGEQYSLPWCVGALEAEGGDLDKARDWLKNWAPTRKEEEGS